MNGHAGCAGTTLVPCSVQNAIKSGVPYLAPTHDQGVPAACRTPTSPSPHPAPSQPLNPTHLSWATVCFKSRRKPHPTPPQPACTQPPARGPPQACPTPTPPVPPPTNHGQQGVFRDADGGSGRLWGHLIQGQAVQLRLELVQGLQGRAREESNRDATWQSLGSGSCECIEMSWAGARPVRKKGHVPRSCG